MEKELETKAKNYFILALIAEKLGMFSEAAANYFKALFALNDAAIFRKISDVPKNHGERFLMLKDNLPELYSLTDKLFSVYRRTYTKDLEPEEVKLVKKRILEAFDYAQIKIPADKEIKEKFAELSKKRENFG